MSRYDKLAGSMGKGQSYGMTVGNSGSGSNDDKRVIKDYALSMQLSAQNTMLRQ